MNSRVIGAAVCAFVLPAAAAASPTIRVEGATSSVIPELPIPAQGAAAALTLVNDTTDTDAVSVQRGSATAQAATAASWLAVPFGFDLFDFGGPSSFITQIGSDKMPPSFSPSWRLKVNHKLSSTGSDTTALKASDSVLWSYVMSFDAPELDLRVASRHRAPGQALRIRVLKYDNDGTATPAPGARVRFAGVTRTADTGGVLTATTRRVGSYWATATWTGAVRSQRQLVCVHPAADGRRCSAVSFPKHASRVPAPHVLTGAHAGFPAGGGVQVSVARLVGSRCRFLQADRRTFSPARSCEARTSVRAQADGNGLWSLRLAPTTGATVGRLLPGSYRVWSRVASGLGVERRQTTGMNTVTFTVTSRAIYG